MGNFKLNQQEKKKIYDLKGSFSQIKILGIKVHSLEGNDWSQKLLESYPIISYLCSNSSGKLLKHHIDINSFGNSDSQKPEFFDFPLPIYIPEEDYIPHSFSQIEFSLTFQVQVNENIEIEVFYEEINEFY